MTNEAAHIEARADILAARITRANGPVRVISHGDVTALRSGRFEPVGFTNVGWGYTDTLWNLKAD